MATATINGETYPLATDWRLSELAEAENALDVDMTEAKGAARMMLVLFISIRRRKPNMPVALVADWAASFDPSGLEMADGEEDAAGPLAETEDTASGQDSQATAVLPTGGLPR